MIIFTFHKKNKIYLLKGFVATTYIPDTIKIKADRSNPEDFPSTKM